MCIVGDTNSNNIVIDKVTRGKLSTGVFLIIFLFKNLFRKKYLIVCGKGVPCDFRFREINSTLDMTFQLLLVFFVVLFM